MQSSWQRFIRKLEASNEVYKESVNEHHHMKILKEDILYISFIRKKHFQVGIYNKHKKVWSIK